MSITNTLPTKAINTATKFHIVIPARYSSERLPGKPLLDICGKTLIQRVYEQASLSNAVSVTVATDDQRIHSAVQAFGGNVCMTSVKHNCGTSRLSEVVDLLNLNNDEIIVNVQGDEPLIPAEMVSIVADELAQSDEAQVSTLATPILTKEEIFSPNVVKVVLTADNYALLFSRAPIPWNRDTFSNNNINENFNTFCLRHVGLYAYRCGTLRQFNKLDKSPLESVEYLEQLRFLWHGKKIKVAVVNEGLPIGVDSQEDLDKVCDLFSKL